MKNFSLTFLILLILSACHPANNIHDPVNRTTEEWMVLTKNFLVEQTVYIANGGYHPELIDLYPAPDICDGCLRAEWEYRGIKEGNAYHADMIIDGEKIRMLKAD